MDGNNRVQLRKLNSGGEMHALRCDLVVCHIFTFTQITPFYWNIKQSAGPRAASQTDTLPLICRSNYHTTCSLHGDPRDGDRTTLAPYLVL